MRKPESRGLRRQSAFAAAEGREGGSRRLLVDREYRGVLPIGQVWTGFRDAAQLYGEPGCERRRGPSGAPVPSPRPPHHQKTAYNAAAPATTPAAQKRAPGAGVKSKSSHTGSTRGASSGLANVVVPMNAAITKNVTAMW